MKKFNVKDLGNRSSYTTEELAIITAAKDFLAYMGKPYEVRISYTFTASEMAEQNEEKYLIWATKERLNGRVW